MDLGGITAGSRIFWDTLVVEKIIENCAQNHTFPPVLLHKSGFFPSPPNTCQVGAPMSWLHGGTHITWGGSVPCEEEPICHMEIGVLDLHGPAQPQPQSNLSEVCPIPYPHHSHGLSTRFWPTGISVSPQARPCSTRFRRLSVLVKKILKLPGLIQLPCNLSCSVFVPQYIPRAKAYAGFNH